MQRNKTNVMNMNEEFSIFVSVLDISFSAYEPVNI